MPNYTHYTGNGFEAKTFFRRPTTNTTRHSWQDNCCRNCGIRRDKSIDQNGRISSYYMDKYGTPIGRRVPECKT
jgi:hypothetical protein